MKKASMVFCMVLAGLVSGPVEIRAAALGEQVPSSLTARQKANRYSFATGGIGIFISYGTKNAVSAQSIGDAFVKEIAKRGLQSKYFFFNTDRAGMAMEFYIGYSALGPWNVDEAASKVGEIVARAKAAQNVHAR